MMMMIMTGRHGLVQMEIKGGDTLCGRSGEFPSFSSIEMVGVVGGDGEG